MLITVGLRQVQNGTVSKPLKITADAAPAITAAIARFDSTIKRGMCWYHMSVKFRERLKDYVDSQLLHDSLDRDITFLQQAPSPTIFRQLLMRFFEKYAGNDDCHAFLVYFRQQWVEKLPNWYEGFSGQSASTNNALESHNRVIKGDVLRQRAPLNQFIENFMELTTFWSLERRFGAPKTFVSSIPIPPRVWTSALIMRDKFPIESIPQMSSNGITTFVMPQHSEVTLPSLEDATIFANPVLEPTTTFDNYRSMAQKWCIVRGSTCSCVNFLKHYMCVHVLCCRMYAGEQPPSNIVAQPIQQKRKRGRPRNTTRALVRQPEE